MNVKKENMFCFKCFLNLGFASLFTLLITIIDPICNLLTTTCCMTKKECMFTFSSVYQWKWIFLSKRGKIAKTTTRTSTYCHHGLICQLRFLGNCPPTLPLSQHYHLLTVRSKCWLRGGVGGQFLRNLNWSRLLDRCLGIGEPLWVWNPDPV